MKTSRTSIALASCLVMLLVLACSFVKVNLPGSGDAPPTTTMVAELVTTAEPLATDMPPASDGPAATSAPAPTGRPTALPQATAEPKATSANGDQSEELVIKLITETQKVDTLKSVLTLNADGEDFDGNAINGDLAIELLANEARGERSFTMQGSLLPLIGGGDLDGATRVGVFQIDDTTYLLTEGTEDNTCRKRPSEEVVILGGEFEDMTPESLLSTISDDEKLYGTLAGEETLNGIAVKHYVIDVQKTIDAAARGSTIESLLNADLYLATEGSYVVSFAAEYDGKLDLWDNGLDGKLTAQFDLVGLNGNVQVDLPEICANAVEETPEPEDMPEGTPESSEPEKLAIRPITETVEVDSMQSVMMLNLDGKDSAGKALKTDVTIELTQNKAKQQQAMVMRGLAELMPAIESPTEVGMYSIGNAMYINMRTAKDTAGRCVKTDAASSGLSFNALLPENLLNSFASEQDTYGVFDGDETINDIDTLHYVIDADATNAAALKSTDPDVRASAKTQKLVSGDIYLAADGNYVVRLAAEYEGKTKSLGFDGNATIEFDLAELNTGVEVELPQACADATAQ